MTISGSNSLSLRSPIIFTAAAAAVSSPSSPMGTYTVHGSLVHADKSATPVPNLKVRIWSDKPFRRDPFTDVEADDQGRFSFSLDRNTFTAPLKIEVIDTPWELKGGERILNSWAIPAIADEVDLGSLTVDFWEYKETFPLLRMPTGGVKPQSFTKGYLFNLAASAAAIKGISFILKLSNYNWPLEEIQKFYGDNLTREVKQKDPKKTSGGLWMGQRILQGFNPCPLQKCEAENHFKVTYNWNAYPFDNDFLLPNAKAYFKLEDAELIAIRVKLQWRKKTPGEVNPPALEPGRLTPWNIYLAEDPSFEWALRAFRVAYLAAGEIDEHLGLGHLNVEQYAVAAFRHLRKSPLRDLLFPHLRDVVLINDQGSSVIFGDEGALTTTTAMTSEGVDRRFMHRIGSADWLGWRPRKPISDKHIFAHVSNLYWGIVNEWVERFFAKKLDGIKNHWAEIQRFSQDLVNHSLPYWKLEGVSERKWVDLNEINPSTEPRPEVAGVTRALHSIVTSQDLGTDVDIARLKQACCYMIFFATFWHSWVHNLQKDDAGDFEYGLLGVQDDKLLTTPKELATQLELANLLPHIKYGFVAGDNPYGDVDSEFVELIMAKSENFKLYGIEVDKFIRTCVNI